MLIYSDVEVLDLYSWNSFANDSFYSHIFSMFETDFMINRNLMNA